MVLSPKTEFAPKLGYWHPKDLFSLFLNPRGVSSISTILWFCGIWLGFSCIVKSPSLGFSAFKVPAMSLLSTGDICWVMILAARQRGKMGKLSPAPGPPSLAIFLPAVGSSRGQQMGSPPHFCFPHDFSGQICFPFGSLLSPGKHVIAELEETSTRVDAVLCSDSAGNRGFSRGKWKRKRKTTPA